jgi:hypothetical protein
MQKDSNFTCSAGFKINKTATRSLTAKISLILFQVTTLFISNREAQMGAGQHDTAILLLVQLHTYNQLVPFDHLC